MNRYESASTSKFKSFRGKGLSKFVLPAALVAVAASAHAQILGVTGSAVQAVFTSRNGVNSWTSNVLSFTYPTYAWFTYNDRQGTFAGTAIEGGFFGPTRGNINSTFIGVPVTSYLQENPAAFGTVASMTLTYSITYAVGARGIAGGIQTGNYLAYGNLAPFAVDPGSFAQFTATIAYNRVGGGFLGGLSMGTTVTWGNGLANAVTGAFSVPVGTAGFINGFAGAGAFTASGIIQWQVDPATLDIAPQSLPEPSAYAVLGVGLVGLLIRRKRSKRA